MYPINQCIPCIGVQDIIAHYIIETIPLEGLYEMFGSIENFIGWNDFMKAYDEGDKFMENNVGTSLLHFIPNMLAYFFNFSLCICKAPVWFRQHATFRQSQIKINDNRKYLQQHEQGLCSSHVIGYGQQA